MSILIILLLLYLIIYIYRFVKKYNTNMVQLNEYNTNQNKKNDLILKKLDMIGKDITKIKNSGK